MTSLEPAARLCLERTRSAVLNVLIGVGVAIAASGFVLRGRERVAVARPSEEIRKALLGSLIAVVFVSYASKRVGANRSSLRDPGRRAVRYFRAHVAAAVLGTLAIPLGLAYGLIAGPRLDAVAPFWVAALALGFLSLPRAIDLEGFDQPMPEIAEPTP